MRILPRTQFGSFARGAKVTVFTNQSGAHTRIIDGGSGYLCQMEPVAHFGLGNLVDILDFFEKFASIFFSNILFWDIGDDEVKIMEVSWPDGKAMTRAVQPGEMNSVVEIAYPRDGEMFVLSNDTQVFNTLSGIIFIYYIIFVQFQYNSFIFFSVW